MTKEELDQIVKRDMPGWSLAEDFQLNHRTIGDDYIFIVRKGSDRKVATISNGAIKKAG
ncbi:MAG: hypothetical protein WD712_01290 [Candidatus Spechtbacterales bacterium]